MQIFAADSHPAKQKQRCGVGLAKLNGCGNALSSVTRRASLKVAQETVARRASAHCYPHFRYATIRACLGGAMIITS